MADQKTTQLDPFTPVLTDLLYGVDDPGGTPVSNRVTLQAVKDLFGVPETVVKTADETVNNSTTLQDDDHLVFAVAANTTYVFDITLLLNAASTTPDFKFGWTVPTGTTMFWGADQRFTGNWADNGGGVLSTESAVRVVPSAAGTSGVKYTGIVRVGGTAGNLQLQWAQGTATAEDSKVLKHSHMVVRELGAT